MSIEPQSKKGLRQQLKETSQDLENLGGWDAFKSGEWLLNLIKRSFRSYYTNANADYFRQKYPKTKDEEIIKKLSNVAATNAGLLGAVTGAGVSANEISAIVAGAASGGLNLPAQITIGGSFLAAEAILLVRIQLQLVANIAKLLGTPLDPDDPEDVLLVLGLAVGGVGAEGLGKFGAKAAGHATKRLIRRKLSGATLEALKKFGNRLGMKILQRSIIKYAVPLASMGIGGVWNYTATRAVAKVCHNHFLAIKNERDLPCGSGVEDASTTKQDGVLRLRISKKLFDLIASGTRKELYLEKTTESASRLKDHQFYEARLRSGTKPQMRTMRIECRKVSTDDIEDKPRYKIVLGRVIVVEQTT